MSPNRPKINKKWIPKSTQNWECQRSRGRDEIGGFGAPLGRFWAPFWAPADPEGGPKITLMGIKSRKNTKNGIPEEVLEKA